LCGEAGRLFRQLTNGYKKPVVQCGGFLRAAGAAAHKVRATTRKFMKTRLFALACIAALLSGCAGAPMRGTSQWNDGLWNSVMGYHGPANSMGMADGPN
jgi:hypothetical protein